MEKKVDKEVAEFEAALLRSVDQGLKGEGVAHSPELDLLPEDKRDDIE